MIQVPLELNIVLCLLGVIYLAQLLSTGLSYLKHRALFGTLPPTKEEAELQLYKQRNSELAEDNTKLSNEIKRLEAREDSRWDSVLSQLEKRI